MKANQQKNPFELESVKILLQTADTSQDKKKKKILAWREQAPAINGWYYHKDIFNSIKKINKNFNLTHVNRTRKQLEELKLIDRKEPAVFDYKNNQDRTKKAIRLKRDKKTFLKLWLSSIEANQLRNFMSSDYYNTNALGITLCNNFEVEFMFSDLNKEMLQKIKQKQLKISEEKAEKETLIDQPKYFFMSEMLVLTLPKLFYDYHTNYKAFEERKTELRELFKDGKEFINFMYKMGAFNQIAEGGKVFDFDKKGLKNMFDYPEQLDTIKLKLMQELRKNKK